MEETCSDAATACGGGVLWLGGGLLGGGGEDRLAERRVLILAEESAYSIKDTSMESYSTSTHRLLSPSMGAELARGKTFGEL